ncbi:MAG: lactate racemase domain-containing protein, partial [Oscillospiraceae bacterium]|nr:lactate racemase domain-containing protein [Oscillospiraceae bacterium]
MENRIIQAAGEAGITDGELAHALRASLEGRSLRKVLLIPPDATRLHSRAGQITKLYYDMLTAADCRVDVLPALGTHEAMSRRECETFLGVPCESLIVHDWREDVVRLGEVPPAFVAEISEGLMDEPVAVEVNRLLTDPSYDLIISVGQVVPHEVVGMANYSKNIFVGCGGSRMINSSHILGALYGVERTLGRADTPVRRLFDYAEERFIAHLPVLYVLTVTTQAAGKTRLDGLYIGRGRGLFDEAARLS